MNTQNDIPVYFNSMHISGHEVMALRVFTEGDGLFKIFAASHCAPQLKELGVMVSDISFLSLCVVNFRRKLIFVNGSPYGNLPQKFALWLFCVHLIEYTPFPELKEMRTRLHHHFAPLINRLVVRKRILIDDWQKKHSSVKKIYVIRNYFGGSSLCGPNI